MRNAIVIATILAGAFVIARSEDLPAPTVDRVGLPKNYEATYPQLRSSENTAGKGDKTIKVVYANLVAASRKTGAYPYGSVLIMETWSAIPDDAGHLRKGKLTGLHVMRKGRGFGEAYRDNRAGEWEYVEYRPDGTYITPPSASAKCAACHLKKAGLAKDFVFGGSSK
jgi:hypothetical protein